MADQPVCFLVARLGWSIWWYDQQTSFSLARRDISEQEVRQFVPVAAFADRIAAEARMRELELEAARIFNPFWIIGLSDDGLARLRSLIGALPAKKFKAVDGPTWVKWWDEQMPTWSDETFAAVWKLFGAVRFYAILEVEAE